MYSFDEELSSALADIGAEFRPNELAYLAATMKIEGPIRDRLAFRLHRDFAPWAPLVAREWKRTDIAILDREETPLCLLELKAMYIYDAISKLKRYTDATIRDEAKASSLARKDTAIYSLLLATHVDGRIDSTLKGAFKYYDQINRSVKQHQSASAVLAQARAAFETGMPGRQMVAAGEIVGGSAFGLDVSVFYWLVRGDTPEVKGGVI